MKWSKSEIRQARKVPLIPLLQKRGFCLRQLSNGNFLIENLMEPVLVKDCYWFSKARGLHGNSIDFFIQIENRSFVETMQILLGSPKPNTKAIPKNDLAELRSCKNVHPCLQNQSLTNQIHRPQPG